MPRRLSTPRRAQSITTGQVPDRVSPSGTTTSTSSHAASVLQHAMVSLATTSAALVIGRVAMNGVTPQESLAEGSDLRTVAAAKAAMKGGVSSATSSV